jgi:hypothetical protein
MDFKWTEIHFIRYFVSTLQKISFIWSENIHLNIEMTFKYSYPEEIFPTNENVFLNQVKTLYFNSYN